MKVLFLLFFEEGVNKVGLIFKKEIAVREPFYIPVDTSLADASRNLFWRELSWGDDLKLGRMFRHMLEVKATSLATEEGAVWKFLTQSEKESYRQQVCDLALIPRGFPIGLHRIMPVVAALGLPNIVRFCQKQEDVKKGYLGRYQFGILWDRASKEVGAFVILQKTARDNEAEVSVWKSPSLETKIFRESMKQFLGWAQEMCDYKNFLAHIQAPTDALRGNPQAVACATGMGASLSGIREPDAPDGNGKKTLIYTVQNWSP